MKKNTTQLGGQEMRDLANKIREEIPGLGFALIVFEFEKSGISNYVSNAMREDMIIAFEETLERLKNNQDFLTPESN